MVSVNSIALVNHTIQHIDQWVQKTPPWRLVCLTAAGVGLASIYATQWFSKQSWNWETKVKTLARCIPSVEEKLQIELRKIEESLEQKYFKDVKKEDVCEEIPLQGWEANRILDKDTYNVTGKIGNQ